MPGDLYEHGRTVVGLLDLASPPQGWGEPASYPPNVIIIIIITTINKFLININKSIIIIVIVIMAQNKIKI